MNKSIQGKTEKKLIFTAAGMVAVIIGYNAFFVPTLSPMSVSNGDMALADCSEGSKTFGSVNINTASTDELEEGLEGIGVVIAKRIVSYRETHGGFSKKEELMNISGINKSVFEKLQDHVILK